MRPRTGFLRELRAAALDLWDFMRNTRAPGLTEDQRRARDSVRATAKGKL